MQRRVLNMYSLHNKTIGFKKYEGSKLIIKFLKKTKRLSREQSVLVKFKQWDLQKKRSVSLQTNVCKRSGAYKRTLNMLGFNRHMIRQYLNVGKLPNLKKLSW